MFKVKTIDIKTSNEYIVLILEKDASELGLNPLDRVKITNPSGNKSVICVLEIIESNLKKGSKKLSLIKSGELGLLETAFEKLGVLENSSVEIVPAKKPTSINYVKKNRK